MTKKVIIYLIVGLLMGSGITYLAFGSQETKNSDQNTSEPTSQVTEQQSQNNQTEEAEPTNQLATIRGSFTYPSEAIPSDLVACAEDSTGNEVVCSNDQLTSEEFIYDKGYELEVEAVGSYYVYAKTSSGQKAYYNGYMVEVTKSNWPDYDELKCETSYQKTAISPNAGEVVKNITLGDWYYDGTCSAN